MPKEKPKRNRARCWRGLRPLCRLRRARPIPNGLVVVRPPRLLLLPEHVAWIESVADKLPRIGGDPDRAYPLSVMLAAGFEAQGIGPRSPLLDGPSKRGRNAKPKTDDEDDADPDDEDPDDDDFSPPSLRGRKTL
jgi:hypothetical protein